MFGSAIFYDVLLSLAYVFAGVDRSGYSIHEVEGAGLFVEEVVERGTRGRGAGAGTGSGFEPMTP